MSIEIMENTLTWYQLFEISEVANLPYVERTFELENYGTVTVRLCKGQLYALVFEDRYLPARLNKRNPFITWDGKYGAVIDDNGWIWLGIQL